MYQTGANNNQGAIAIGKAKENERQAIADHFKYLMEQSESPEIKEFCRQQAILIGAGKYHRGVVNEQQGECDR